MSFFGFNVAGSALNAFQEAENITSQNIANVQTPGASRQVAQIGQLPPVTSPVFPNHGSPGTKGDGIFIEQIQRIHSDSYDQLFRGASGSQNYYQTQQQQLQQTQGALGEPSAGLNKAFVNFQSAVQALANNPTGIPERANILASAQQIVSSLNNSSLSLLQQQQQVKLQATSIVSTINNDLDKIAQLNAQIRASSAVGDNPNTYKDQRDKLIDDISQYLPTQTAIQANGSTLVTVNGYALVNDTVVYHLASPVVGTDLINTNNLGAAELKIGFANDPNPTNPTPVNIQTGQLGALLDLYNNKLPAYQHQLDSFAGALANESARITNAGYDSNGVAGGNLFQPVQGPTASAGNIKVGITDPSQVPATLASTAAGTLVLPLNAGNNTVDTTQQIIGNTSLANPPGAAFTGSINVTVDGFTQNITYHVGAGAGTIDASTIDSFVAGFNAQRVGITASFDTTAQKIVFARDPNNIDAVHRALQGANPATPDFTLEDTALAAAVGPAQPSLGTPATALFTALGANQINLVNQNATNAFGAASGAGANALLGLFNNSLGAPSIQTSVVIPAGGYAAGTSITITSAAFSTIKVGDTISIYDGTPPTTANQENVTVTGIDLTGATPKITFTVAKTHSAANTPLYVAGTQTQTLQNYYSTFISRLGLDGQTATSGTASQTSLATNIDAARQSVDGINIDEETQNLIKYQNAYAAAAHTISVLDSLLKTAIGLAG